MRRAVAALLIVLSTNSIGQSSQNNVVMTWGWLSMSAPLIQTNGQFIYVNGTKLDAVDALGKSVIINHKGRNLFSVNTQGVTIYIDFDNRPAALQCR